MLDDLYQADTNAALDDLQRRPPAAKTQTAKFSAWSMLTAAPRGIGAGSNETAGGVADVLGAFGQVMGATDSRASMFSAQTEDQRKQEEQARRKMLDKGLDFDAGDSFRSVAREWMPDATTAHTAERTVFDLFRFGTKAVTSTALAGPVAGPVLTGLDEALTTADDLKRQGVDAETRMKVGAVSGVTAAMGVALPVAGRNPVQTAALVAVGGPGSFIAQQAATRQILQDADYTKLADQIDPLDPVGLAVSTLVPAGFGVWAMRGMRGRAAEVKPGEPAPEVRPDAAPVQDAVQTEPARPRPTPDQVDAARVEMLTQHVESARLTPVEDAAGARAHSEAMTRAMDQLAAGERVQVADVAPVPRVAPTDTPEFKAWFGDSKVVDESGKPLVLYHATPRQFDEFKTQGNQTTSGDKLDAAFFTDSADYVEAYAIEKRGQPVSTVPAYVAMRNPLVVDAEARGFSDPKYEQPIIERARADGHDGVIFRDEMTGANFYAVFEPQQIKSAIGNSGKFDASSPSLTDSRFASWADQIRAAIDEIRAAAKEAANVQDAPGQIGEARTGDATEGAAIRRSGWYTSQGKDIDRQVIRADAESLASTLRSEGFGVEVQHSGSVIGPSSYLNITDPQTGRHFINQVRLSAHAKTGFQATHVWDVTPAQFGFVMEEARKMRSLGVSEGMKKSIAAAEQYEAVALRKRLASADKKLAKGKPLTKSEQEAVDARARGELPNFEQPAPDEGGANVQDAPQARADAPATGARQPEPAAQPQAADARGAAPAGAAEQGGGVPRAGGATPEAAAVAARLADVSQQFPDLTVKMDGMDAPMRLSEFLDQVQREAMDGTDMDLGGNDAPLMQVAASCFLLNG